MNYKQNEKINQVKESTLVVGIDIGSTTQYARAFDWRTRKSLYVQQQQRRF